MAPKRTAARATKESAQAPARRGGATWLTSFLDFVVDSQTFDNPAPFCWEDFRAVMSKTPPWSPLATPTNSDCTAEEIEQVRAYAQAYYSASNRVAFDREVRRGSDMSDGRAVAQKWLMRRVVDSGLNSRIDAFLETANVLPAMLISAEMTGVSDPHLSSLTGSLANDGATQLPPADRGWAAVDMIVEEWFGDAARETFEMNTAAENFVYSLITLVWNRWRRNIKRDKERIEKLDVEFESTQKPRNREWCYNCSYRFVH